MPKFDSPVISKPLELTEPVLAVMRAICEEREHWLAEYRKLAPGYGEIPVGSEHIRAFHKSECLAWYLMRLRDTGNPDAALKAAEDEGVLICQTWNRRREYQVHIWTETYHHELEMWNIRVKKAAQQ